MRVRVLNFEAHVRLKTAASQLNRIFAREFGAILSAWRHLLLETTFSELLPRPFIVL